MAIDEETTRLLLNRSQDRPNIARVYDYFLGGGYNFEKDREFAKKILAKLPQTRTIVRANRHFLHRVIRYAIDHEVYQFIDIGAGLPTQDAVHHQCEAYAKNLCRVLYVDNDPIAAAHSQYLLEEGGDGFGAVGGLARFAAACENFYDPKSILKEAVSQAHMDLDKPVCIILLSMLHTLENPEAALSQYRAAVASGSLLALSHIYDEVGDEAMHSAVSDYQETNSSAHFRERDEIADFFGGWPLAEPGLVWLSDWRPDAEAKHDGDPRLTGMLCGVATKPAS